MVRWESLGDEPIGHEAVRHSVHIQVQPEVEVVIVIDGDDVLVDEAAVGIGLPETRSLAVAAEVDFTSAIPKAPTATRMDPSC
jgi:hypothetical protein